jgi:hypothetical protein
VTGRASDVLIDLLTSTKTIASVHKAYLPVLQTALKKAVKFELSPDFAAAAEGLAEDLRNVAKALPYCRLPFPLTWIEVAQQNRPRFSEAPIHVPEIQGVPSRIGFLLSAGDKELSAFMAFQFWEIKKFPGIGNASNMATMFDTRRANDPYVEPKVTRKYLKIEDGSQWKNADPITRSIINNVVVPCIPAYLEGPLDITNDEQGQFLTELGAADWSGESTFLLATLALMNTLNATESTEVDVSKLNKIRARKNYPLLNNHYVLRIHPRIRRGMVRRGMSTSHGDIRGHLVRGHWKVRKQGVIWWRPFARGDKNNMIDKSYKVE